MQRRTIRTAAAAGVVIAATAIGAGVAIASSTDVETNDVDLPLGGTALEQATDSALVHTGGGTVIETEIGDDGAAYGVEIRLTDGSVVEVNLDAGFHVISQEIDEDGTAREAGDDD